MEENKRTAASSFHTRFVRRVLLRMSPASFGKLNVSTASRRGVIPFRAVKYLLGSAEVLTRRGVDVAALQCLG